jgi:hypothetical protein
MFKSPVLDATCGPYLAIKTHIKSATTALLQTARLKLKKAAYDMFGKTYGDFD